MIREFAVLAVGFVCALSVGNGRACDVPVFRYALEEWPSDLYSVTVFHRGALSVDQEAVVKALQSASDDGIVNLEVALVDVTGTLTDAAENLWKAQTNSALPLVVVQYPAITRLEAIADTGPLTAAFAKQLLDSPVRREVRQRILRGESIVWVLLESGNKASDDAVAGLLRRESNRLAGLLELPPVDSTDPRTDENVSLKIAFSLVRLSRTDPAEQLLVHQLVNINPQFAEAKEPLVFPVFGRGRALCGLGKDELNPEDLEDVATFLTGSCSCEVKAMNPGLDLLIAADWDALIEGRAVKEPELPPLVSLSQLAAQAQTPLPTPTTAKVAQATTLPPKPATLGRNLIAVIGLGIVVVCAGTLLLRNRSRKP